MAFYGLVQSTYLWFGNWKKTLENFGFSQLKYDNASFYNTSWSLYIIIYIDNIKAFCLNNTIISYIEKVSIVKIQIKKHKQYYLIS